MAAGAVAAVLVLVATLAAVVSISQGQTNPAALTEAAIANMGNGSGPGPRKCPTFTMIFAYVLQRLLGQDSANGS